MSKVRPSPCEACPYRRDVPSGIWSAHEYEKLRAFDLPTMEQPMATFSCHASPEAYCHGWAVVHSNRERGTDLLALRLRRFDGEIPEPAVPLFASGNEAADHGMRDIEEPSEEAVEAQHRLMRKHPRLRERYEGAEA